MRIRWSSYGEAVGGGAKGNGKKAREGLVRAITSDTDTGFDAGKWKGASRRYRRLRGIALGKKTLNSKLQTRRKSCAADGMNEAESFAALKSGKGEATESHHYLPELSMAKMLRHRVRYFTDVAVIGSKEFVNEAFDSARDRFSGTRKDGARRMRGNAAAARDLWSMRALRVGIE